MSKDYYKILGVNKSASPEDIKKAFRRLAHEYHPDKKGGDAAKFKEINEANQVLSDSKKRAQYDQYGSEFVNQAGASGAGGPFGGFGGQGFEFNVEDMGDLFGGLGDMFGFGGGKRSRQQKGEDIVVDIELTIQEACFGAERTIRLNKLSTCENCKGSGGAPGTKISDCRHCGGRGQVTRVQQTILGAMQSVATCAECRGQGKVAEKACSTCSGTGVHKRDDELTIKIPGGIHDGEAVRISGRGNAAPFGGASGNLFVRVHVKQNKDLQRDGDDIYSDLHISFPTAVLGGELATTTLEGSVTIKIPEGVHAGELIRLKGKGATRRSGSGRGDHFVRINIAVPKKVSRTAKKLLEQLEGEL